MKNKIGILSVLFKIGPKILSILAKSTKFILVGVSFSAYAYLYSWQFSLIIISMLIIHEYGHIWAMQRCGLKTKGIYLIPFFGGLAVSEGMAKNRADEVFIAMMGPVFGFGLALLSMVAYYITDNPLFAGTASWMALVNIINLFPVMPLDGGRVMKSIAMSANRKFGLVYMVVALCILVGASIGLGLWSLLILVLIGAIETVFEYKNMKSDRELDDIQVNVDKISEQDKIATMEQLRKKDEMKDVIIKDGRSIHDITMQELIDSYRSTGTVKLDRFGILMSMLFYLSALAALGSIMYLMSKDPAAALAIDMLR